MVKPVNARAIEDATGASWIDWCAFLDKAGAAKLDHNAIVKKTRTFREISGWWAQGVAVAYEQHIGRRKPGQRSDGLFNASVSRTIHMSQQAAFKSWCDFASGLDEIGGQVIAGTPTTSTTPKRQYWRCKFDDGSSASVGFEPKGAEKVLIGIEHQKLGRESLIADRKSAWVGLLKACFTA